MEDKQLDFNQPFLSVRRISSTVGTSEAEVKSKTDNSLPKIRNLPVYKSDLKSGPIRNPGTVPFMWEQTPGRPKDGSKSQSQALEHPPVAPKLPPGRIFNVKQQDLDKGSDSTKSTWTRTGNVPASSQSVSNSDNNATKWESSIEEMVETASSSTEDSDEAYVDAVDILSRTESFYLNCSVSGVSGLDGADLKPSGTFATDPQTRDFMMGRFLPAAKAMASETPHCTTRKPPMAREQSRHNRIISVDKRLPIRQYSPNNVHFLAQDKRLEEKDDEDAYDGHENLSSTVCGLLPRFCLKNFCLLNPVPGMRVQAQEPIVSVRGAHARNSYSSSCIDSQNQDVCELNQKIYGNKDKKLDGSSLYSRLQGNVESPNENVSSQSVFNEPKRFVEVPEKAMIFEVIGSDPCSKGNKNFRELLACESTKWESGAASPIEKTLYIDSVHKVESPNSNSYSPGTKRLSDDRGDDFDSLVKNTEIQGTLQINSSLQDIKHWNMVDEKAILRPKSLEFVNSNFFSSPAQSAHGMEIDVKSNSTEVAGNEKIALETQLCMKSSNRDISHGLIQYSVSSTSSKKADAGRIDSTSSPETSPDHYSQLLLPLPPPKSPSDSWLKRTLPTVSKKNSSSSWSSLGTHDYTRVEDSSKMPSVNPKWETIVKTSNVMHGHLRFPEELLTPIPEN